MVTVDQGAGWALGFHNPKWTLTNNQTFQIALTFDGQRPFNVQGVAISGNLIRVPMPVNSTLVAEFRKAKAMTAFTQGQLFQFKLDQTAVLLPTLANCVAMVKQQGIANAGDFSVKVAPKAVAAAAAPSVHAGGSLRPAPASNPSSDLQIEAIELASNFILKTTLHNPRVLSRSEMPGRRCRDRCGMEFRRSGRLRQDRPAKRGCQRSRCRFRRGGDGCKRLQGKFASGRTSELVDSDVVFRGFSSCEDSDGPRISQYFIVSRKKGGFVLFSVVSNMKTEEAKTLARDERLADFRKAALVVVDH